MTIATVGDSLCRSPLGSLDAQSCGRLSPAVVCGFIIDSPVEWVYAWNKQPLFLTTSYSATKCHLNSDEEGALCGSVMLHNHPDRPWPRPVPSPQDIYLMIRGRIREMHIVQEGCTEVLRLHNRTLHARTSGHPHAQRINSDLRRWSASLWQWASTAHGRLKSGDFMLYEELGELGAIWQDWHGAYGAR